jgi:hypothetical protein
VQDTPRRARYTQKGKIHPNDAYSVPVGLVAKTEGAVIHTNTITAHHNIK